MKLRSVYFILSATLCSYVTGKKDYFDLSSVKNCTDGHEGFCAGQDHQCQIDVPSYLSLVVSPETTCGVFTPLPGECFYNQLEFYKVEGNASRLLKIHQLSKDFNGMIGINDQTGKILVRFAIDSNSPLRCKTVQFDVVLITGTSLNDYCRSDEECIANTDFSSCSSNSRRCRCAGDYCTALDSSFKYVCNACPGIGQNCTAECAGYGVYCISEICACSSEYELTGGYCIQKNILAGDTAARVALIAAIMVATSLLLGISWNVMKRHSWIQTRLRRRRERRIAEHRRTGSITSLSQEIENRLRDRPPAYAHAVEDKPPSYDESTVEDAAQVAAQSEQVPSTTTASEGGGNVELSQNGISNPSYISDTPEGDANIEETSNL